MSVDGTGGLFFCETLGSCAVTRVLRKFQKSTVAGWCMGETAGMSS